MDRPHDVGIDRVAGRRPRDAEVRHLRGSVRGDNDILRFYVPVDNAIVMRSLKSGRNLQRNAHGFPDGQSSPVLDIQLQRDALYQLHHDKVVPVFLADVEYIDDIRVRQTGRGLGFHPEFGHKFPVSPEFRFQNLDRDIPVQLMVPRLVHVGHPAGSYAIDYLISVL